jgi:hypothetical protein
MTFDVDFSVQNNVQKRRSLAQNIRGLLKVYFKYFSVLKALKFLFLKGKWTHGWNIFNMQCKYQREKGKEWT